MSAPFKVRNEWEVANQFVIRDNEGNRWFQSYRTMIAKIDVNGQVTLDPDWQNTATTNKYRCKFLGENGKETAKKVKDGTYKVENLN